MSWRSPREVAHFTFHFAPIIGFGAAALQLSNKVREHAPPNCIYPVDYLPDWWLVPVGLIGLMFGRFISLWREHTEPQPTTRSKTFAQSALVFLFLFLAAVWFMEAVGTAHVPIERGQFDPITWYVRCAIYEDRATSALALGPWTHIGGWTVILVFLVGSTAGHWFWSYHRPLRAAQASRHAMRPGQVTIT